MYIFYIYSIYIHFLCHRDFQNLKKDLQNLFCSCRKDNFGANHILPIFRIIFLKN